MKKVVVLALALCAGGARAQESGVGYSTAFEVDRLAPAPGPGTFLQVEDGDVAPHLARSFALVSSVISRPLVLRSCCMTPTAGKGEELSVPVSVRAGAELLAALGLGGRYQLGLAVPVVLFQDGDRLRAIGLAEPGADQALAATALGDVRVHAKVRIAEPPRGYGLASAIDLVVTLPTGDEAHFAGEAGVVVEPRLIVSWRGPRLAAAVNLGPRVRETEVRFFDPELIIGNEVAWGLAAQARVPRLPAAWAATALAEVAGAYGDQGANPAEARLGARVRVTPTWSVGAAGGVGLGTSGAIGAPAFRGVIDLRFEPKSKADSDRDLVPDVDDRCFQAAEDRDGYQDADGCPDLDDDQDGIPDASDQCRTQAEDLDNFRDADGCPDPDNDQDGVADGADRCPAAAEDRDGFADGDGCPDGDDDADGLPDGADACPREAEDRDGWQDDDGCPDRDNDQDGVPDDGDRCPTEVEDKDGFLDDDGCQDADDDRDGVPDGVDACPTEPETITSVKDTEQDGCPDGEPMAKAAPDGTVWLSPAARAALRWKFRQIALSPEAEVVALAVARAAHRAGWDETRPALVVTVFADKGGWSELAAARSEQLAEALVRHGVAAVTQSATAGKGVLLVAPEDARERGATVPHR